MNIVKKDLENLSDEIFYRMSKIFSADKIDIFKQNFLNNFKEVYTKTINYCIEKFVQTEFDFESPGNRGIGRLTESLPRLGAYFRKSFHNLEKSDLENLNILITRLIIKGYLFAAIINKKSQERVLVFTDEELYKEWIPKIFTFNLNIISDNAGSILLFITERDVHKIKSYFVAHDMRGGGIFSKDKSEDILIHYIIAGVSLYYIEKLKIS